MSPNSMTKRVGGRLGLLLLWAMLLSPLSACEREGACSSVNDCYAADESGLDLLWTCSEGTCVDVPCESSRDCPMATTCITVAPEDGDGPSKQVCAEGCQGNDDCPAGAFCRAGVCEEKPCRNGHLDCELGEVCEGGVCVHAGSPYCQDCNPNFNDFDLGDPWDSCDTTFLGHPSCGDGNFCWNLPGGPSCGTPCQDNSDCPGGFSCGQALMSAPNCEGGFLSFGRFCVTDFCFNRL